MFRKQFCLLLWKNLILRKRHWVRTVLEIVWPLILFAILVAIRFSQSVDTIPECHYRARAMPSAGVYPLFKSFVCDLTNPCINHTVPSEIPGQVNKPFNSTSFLSIFSTLLTLINENDQMSRTNFTDAINSIKQGSNLSQIISKFLSVKNQGKNSNSAIKSLVTEFSKLQNNGNPSTFSSIFGANSSTPGLNNFCGYGSEYYTNSNDSTSNHTDSNNSTSNHTDSNDIMSNFLQNLTSNLNVDSHLFCSDLYRMLENTNNTRYYLLYNMTKPFILGKIPYCPNTPMVKRIISNANSTFETLALIQKFGELWLSTLGPKLYMELYNGSTINQFRNVLNSIRDIKSLHEGLSPSLQQLNTSVEQESTSIEELNKLRIFLSNDDSIHNVTTWKDDFKKINMSIALITKLLECFELNKFVGFDDEETLVEYSLKNVHNKTLWAGIVFLLPNSTDSKLPNIVKYKIRQAADSVTKTTITQYSVWRPGAFSNLSFTNKKLENPNPVHYFTSGFVHMQDMIENAIIMAKSEDSNGNNNLSLTLGNYLQEMPYPCYTNDVFMQLLPLLFSLLMTLSWIYSVCIIIKNIVYEKEKRLKEVMKMMGLSNNVHWTAWFVNSFIVMFSSISLLIMFLRIGKILPNSNLFIVFIWLSSFAIATITQCFLISCFFSKANLAAACGGIIFFVLYLPYNVVFVFNNVMTLPLKIVACLLSSVAFGYGAAYMSQYEMSGDGIQFYNWAKSYDPNDQMNFLKSVVMMLVDSVLYMTLTWYLENVFPGTYGVPKPWNFFLKPSYWNNARKKSQYEILANSSISEVAENPDVKLEKEPSHLKLGVSMHRLRKVFNNGKAAVNDLSLNFYEGQITSFLGHNGAGKTTTMSMLTGLYTPTSGTASIYGCDIRSEMDRIRYQLGFCPQHNVLFGDLTVIEHLQFYSGLKCAVGGAMADTSEINEMLKDVGLPHKKNEISRHLSGGMKRKLSVAVAFVGSSKCVILDEPTAGVDPYARRSIWDLLLRYKSNRTIILSTHHMDEADLLGDRIAIISHGQLKCCGSSLFLKSTYGVGYYLTVVKNSDRRNGSEAEHNKTSNIILRPDLLQGHCDDATESGESCISVSNSDPCASTSTPIRRHTVQTTDAADSTRINSMVFNIIPQAKIQEDNHREISFVLPYSAQTSGKYCKLFHGLDEAGFTYGLTDTSLEEIFINIAEQTVEGSEEEVGKCCFCIPRRTKKVDQRISESPDGQARRGMLRSTRSITSNFSGHSSAHLLSQFHTEIDDGDDVSLLNIGDLNSLDNEDLFIGVEASQGAGSNRVMGNQLVKQQFFALFVKRFHHSKRDRKGFLAQFIVPSCFIALGLLCALSVPPVQNYPPLELQPWMYGSTNTFYSDDKPQSNLSLSISNSLLNSPSIGMRCVQNYHMVNYNGDTLTCDGQANGTWLNDYSIAGHSQYITSNKTLTCRCTADNSSVLLADCPSGAGGSPMSRVSTQTSDWMYNMTQRNLSDWLVKTVDRFIQKRYGGLSFGEKFFTNLTVDQITPFIKYAEFNSNYSLNTSTRAFTPKEFSQNLARTENAKIWFDNSGFHSMPIWINVKSNAALRSVLSPDDDPNMHGIVAINHPLNFTINSLDAAARFLTVKWVLVAICSIFALSFIPASFVIYLIDEKVTKSKHLQFVSGVNPSIYWISTFVWDMITYAFAITIVILIFFLFQTKAFVSSENFPCLVCLLVLYGFSITPLMYPASFYFEIPSTAYVFLTCINILVGVVTSVVTFILEALEIDTLKTINNSLRKFFLVFPQYCLGRGLMDMAVDQSFADARTRITGKEHEVHPFEYRKVGRNLIVMAVEGLIFFVFTLLIQYKFFIKPCGVKNSLYFSSRSVVEDNDIVRERRRVLDKQNDDILKIKNLSKVYRKRGRNSNLVAVDRLCLGVPRGECFGLLGVNGAGKTTTFKMLTGDTVPTAGDAFVCGQSILDNIREVQQNIGYCPQFEALNSRLTGREHLSYYAKLRGVPKCDIDSVTKWSINKFGLSIYADKPAGTYSGGNKRKLSAAIAFIGSPPIVFLDEPTAGMDPMSRRFLWSRITEAVRSGRSVVLTSHSMEECEALCTRLAIMVNGILKCIGSPQHLKNSYGEGYTLSIKVSDSNHELVQNFIGSNFTSSVLKESHCNMLIYHLPFQDIALSNLFTALENAKKSLQVEDYSINQTTLDEVFINFANNQNDALEDEYGFQPLNDDIIGDYSQLADRARESPSNRSDIALYDLTNDLDQALPIQGQLVV